MRRPKVKLVIAAATLASAVAVFLAGSISPASAGVAGCPQMDGTGARTYGVSPLSGFHA